MPKPVLWIDITELFGEFSRRSHPTGISRVAINLTDRLAEDRGAVFGSVRPIFWHPTRRLACRTDIEMLRPLTAFFRQWRGRLAAEGLVRSPRRSRLRKSIVTAVPKPLRYAVFPAESGAVQFDRWARRNAVPVEPAPFGEGDCVFVPGSYWLGGYMPRLVRHAKGCGSIVTAFVHDLLLLSDPELLGRRHASQFRRGAETFLPECAAVACNSSSTRATLLRHIDIPADLPIRVCRLGDVPDSGQQTETMNDAVRDIVRSRYVLYVSTVQPRKNHGLLVSAWSRLRAELGERTPRLVFVGGGQPDAALARALSCDAGTSGPVVWLRDVDDADLEALYRNAWITAYPSLGEGYGLPVAEALARGKVCMAAPIDGIREAGGDLLEPIDPHDPASVVRIVRHFLEAPEGLIAREAEIKRRYTPTTWHRTAEEIRDLLETAVTAARARAGKGRHRSRRR